MENRKESKTSFFDEGMFYYDYDQFSYAFTAFQKGAQFSDPNALFMLGQCYEKGQGTEKNEKLALKHYEFASLLGSKEALRLLEKQYPTHAVHAMIINVILIGIRYKDSIPLLEAKDLKESELKLQTFVKAMLLGYGGTHASQGMSLFNDDYLREEADLFEDDKTSKLSREKYHAMDYLKGNKDNLKSLPIGSKRGVERTAGIRAHYIKDNSVISTVNKEFHVLHTRKKDFKTLHEILATTGQFPSKDDQLWMVANHPDFKKYFIELFEKYNLFINDKTFDRFISNIDYKPSRTDIVGVKKNIIDMLSGLKRTTYSGQQWFYLNVMKDIINPLPLEVKEDGPQYEQTALAIKRLEYILQNALHSAKYDDIFLLYINYAFDEIIFINTLLHRYNQDDMKNILTNFIEEQYLVMKHDQLNTQVALGRSGMDMLSNVISLAINEVKGSEDFKVGHISIQQHVYYEIPEIVRYQFGNDEAQPYTKKFTIQFDNKKGKIETNPSMKMLDIMVCGFVENVSFFTLGFQSENIFLSIDEQLDLRSSLLETKRRLIVIIDTTLHNFSDDRMSTLLMRYKSEIQNGLLAIITTHSLNKYFHMGIDKTPAAISAVFFNPSVYPLLQQFYKNEWLCGYQYDDPTPQIVVHLILNAHTKILKYYDIIKRNTEFIYEELIPSKLYESDIGNLITIDYPYTSDLYPDMWTFIVFRMHFTNYNYMFLKNIIENIITLLNIKIRDGYGYSTITKCVIGDCDGRISIGTESKDKIQKTLKPLITFFREINEIVKLYPQRLGGDYTKFAIHALSNNLINKLSFESKGTKNPALEVGENAFKEGCLEEKKKNYNKAFILLHNAAKNGFSPAIYRIAEYHERGILQKPDLEEALAWYCIAGLHDHPLALKKAADFYKRGIHTKKDLNTVNYLLEKEKQLDKTSLAYRLTLDYSSVPLKKEPVRFMHGVSHKRKKNDEIFLDDRSLKKTKDTTPKSESKKFSK